MEGTAQEVCEDLFLLDFGSFMAPATSLLLAVLCTVLLVGALFSWCPFRIQQSKNIPFGTTESSSSSPIPFIYVTSKHGEDKSSMEEANRAILSSLAQFRWEASQAMQGLSAFLEKALDLEASHPSYLAQHDARLSRRLEHRINQTSKCLQEQQDVLEKILLHPGFRPILALPDEAMRDAVIGTTEAGRDASSTANSRGSKSFIRPPSKWKQRYSSQGEEHTYDSATQIVAHLVRDWTSLGAQIRHSLYSWCISQLDRQSRSTGTFGMKRQWRVLVPGAGLGRLAFDIASNGYIVEANEFSPVMAAAAQHILQHPPTAKKSKIFPYLLDRMSNEVDSDERFRAVSFPDSDTSLVDGEGALSFTIGSFVGSYYKTLSRSYDSIVTCFFLDTATNVYEYLDLIHNLLQPKGIWINVGPLQWHANAMLFPAADELRALVASRFQILHWSIDTEPTAYRDTEHMATNYDGYRPLRFVARRR